MDDTIIHFFKEHAMLSGAFIVLTIAYVIFEIYCALKGSNKSRISAEQLVAMINHQRAVVIDIRAPKDYRAGHIVNAVNISAKELKEGKRLMKFQKKPIVIVCGDSRESEKLVSSLQNRDYRIFSVIGGMRAWKSADMPIVRG